MIQPSSHNIGHLRLTILTPGMRDDQVLHRPVEQYSASDMALVVNDLIKEDA